MKGYSKTRVVVIGLELFLGLTAVAGGLFVVPAIPVELLRGTPFTDYTIPAFVLVSVVGGSALAAAVGLLLGREWGVLASVVAGMATAIFEVVQSALIGLDVWLQATCGALGLAPVHAPGRCHGEPRGFHPALWLQQFYFTLGLLIIALALRLWLRTAAEGDPTTLRLPEQALGGGGHGNHTDDHG